MPKLSLVSSDSSPLPVAVTAGRCFRRIALAVAVCLFGADQMRAQTATETVVHSFTGSTDGEVAAGSLIQAGDGQMYGTTLGDFFTNYGGMYKVALNGTLTPLYTFNGFTDSAEPFGALIQGADGNFYGTTYGNLIFTTDGSVFELTPAGVLTTLYSFTGGTDGENPESALVQLSDGTFYGVTPNGGSGNGTLFHLGTATAMTTVASFSGITGAAASTPPVEGTDGNFYGVTSGGGPSSFGTVYQLTPSGTLTTIYSFKGTGDGAAPFGPLVEGPDGSFYGATGANASVTGGDKNGTIFKITTGGVLTTLHLFNGTTDGSGPAGLFLGGDGNLYGNTSGGGTNSMGTVFRVTTSGTLTTLYNFNSGDAIAPQMGVIEASDGTIWGTGSEGGANSVGGVYKVTLSPAPAAPVTLTASAATFALGDSVTLSWSVNNAFSNTIRHCNASITPAPVSAAGWTGAQTSTFDATTNILSGSATITPAYPGVYTYGLTCGGVESGTTTLTVGSAAALTITSHSPLPTGYVGVAYSQTIGMSGGVEPYTFSVSVGSLPAGLTLNTATGAITGKPTTTGAGNFTIKVTDSNASGAASATAAFAITVLQPLTLVTASLPDGRIGSAYSQQLTASGGTTPYTFSVAPGSTLPAGLTMSTTGLISGTPTVATSSTFNVEVVDSGSQSIVSGLSLTIDPLLSTTGVLTLTPASISVGGTTVAGLTITPPSGSPAMTGTVQFTANGQTLGSPVPLASGVASLTTPAFNTSGTVVIAAFYSGDANFLALGYPSANLAVNVAAQPAIFIAPSVASVVQGQATTVNVTLANFAAGTAVALSCGTLPATVTCAFSDVANNAATLTLRTSADTAASIHERQTLWMACLLPGLLLLGFAGRHKRMLSLAVLVFLGAAISGCGDHTTTTLAGTGTSVMTVTATAGSQTASTQFTLVVHK